MDSSVVAPIAYLEPAVDHWPRIFRILAIISQVFGAFFAMAAIFSFRYEWQSRQLSAATTEDLLRWGPLVVPFIDLLFGLGIIAGGDMLLKRKPYEFLIQGLKFVVFMTLFDTCIGIYRSREYLSWEYLLFSVGNLGKVVSFPLLVILILLAHRKAHPLSPLAAKPNPHMRSSNDDDLPLLRQ